MLGLCFSLAHAQSAPSQLEVEVVQGEGAVNRIRQRATVLPAVRVTDEMHKPIAGAAVVFTLPTEGATGDLNGEKTTIVTTGADGVASVKAMKLNATPGKLPIHVSVSYRGLTARAVINQESVLAPGDKAGRAASRGHGTLIAVLVCVGGAVGGGAAYLASQGNKTAAAPSAPVATAIGITPGTGTIAGGR